MLSVKMAIRNIRRRKIRSLLTIMGVAISIAAIVGVSAISVGMKHDIKAAIGGSASLIVKSKSAPDPISSAMDQSIEYKIKKLKYVKKVVAVWFNNRVVQVDGVSYPIMITAVEHGDYDFIVGSKVIPIKGHLPRNGEIAFGAQAWRVFNERTKLKIGEKVNLQGVVLKLSGEFKTSSQLANMCAITTLKSVKPIRGNTISCLFIQTDKPDYVKKEIERKFKGVQAISTSNAVKSMLNNLKTVELAAIALTSIAGVVGALGVSNTMLMSVLERRREIGIMKAVGATKYDIMKIFIVEAIILSLIGGVIGVVLGAVGARIVIYIISELKGTSISVMVTPSVVLFGIATAVLIGVISGIYPAWKAAKVDPVKVLRDE